MPDPPETPKRPRGRPRKVDERGSAVTAWIPDALHDRLIALANRHDRSVSATVRALLIKRTPDRK